MDRLLHLVQKYALAADRYAADPAYKLHVALIVVASVLSAIPLISMKIVGDSLQIRESFLQQARVLEARKQARSSLPATDSPPAAQPTTDSPAAAPPTDSPPAAQPTAASPALQTKRASLRPALLISSDLLHAAAAAASVLEDQDTAELREIPLLSKPPCMDSAHCPYGVRGGHKSIDRLRWEMVFRLEASAATLSDRVRAPARSATKRRLSELLNPVSTVMDVSARLYELHNHANVSGYFAACYMPLRDFLDAAIVQRKFDAQQLVQIDQQCCSILLKAVGAKADAARPSEAQEPVGEAADSRMQQVAAQAQAQAQMKERVAPCFRSCSASRTVVKHSVLAYRLQSLQLPNCAVRTQPVSVQNPRAILRGISLLVNAAVNESRAPTASNPSNA